MLAQLECMFVFLHCRSKG